MERGRVKNTGPDKVGQGRIAGGGRFRGGVGTRGRAGQGGCDVDQIAGAHSDAGCVPANRAPKGANPEKMFDARDLPRLCPPHTGPARVEPRPGERGAAPDKGLGKQSICRPYVPPAYRFYASEPEEMSRLKFNLFCGLSCVLTTLSRGIARGSSGTLSLRFVFV